MRCARSAPPPARWPQPLLNPPHLVGNLDRDKLHRVLDEIERSGNSGDRRRRRARNCSTCRVRRSRLATSRPILRFPPSSGRADRMPARALRRSMIVPRWKTISTGSRRRNSSSRVLSITRAMTACFANTGSSLSTADPTRAIMAIADRWDIWYLNAGMSLSAGKRREEETFMRTFDSDFARRHRTALSGNRRADRSRLFYGRLCGNQKRIAAGFRGRQYRDRARHGSRGPVSLQAAADAQGYSTRSRPCSSAARGSGRERAA